MDEFFLQARSLLFQGEYKISAEVYQRLFDVLELGEEPGHLPGDPDCVNMLKVDIDEQVVLFLMSIYMNSAPTERLALLYESIKRYRDLFGDVTLKNIVDAADTLLPDFDIFLADLIGFLKNQSPMIDSELLREAIALEGGVPAISEFARQYAVTNTRKHMLTGLQLWRRTEIQIRLFKLRERGCPGFPGILRYGLK